MTVDLQALAGQASSIITDGKYQLLVLGLEIANPTQYELAENNTSVVIVIDLNSAEWDDALAKNLPEGGVRTLFPIPTV